MGRMSRLAALGALALLSCAEDFTPRYTGSDVAPFTDYKSERYQDDALWLCRPGLSSDRCGADALRATEVLPDGGLREVAHAPAASPKVDCFYVYPTVDLGLIPSNTTNFDDVEQELRATLNQAARFTEHCALYVPLYRQASIAAFADGTRDAARERVLGNAYSDVLDAFRHYMGQHNQGRKVVLIGHSQGSYHLRRLLKDVFDGDAQLRERLLVAFALGWWFYGAPQAQGGGAFANLTACRGEGELGCVFALRSTAEGQGFGELTAGADFPAPGDEWCTHPADPSSDAAQPLALAWLPASGTPGLRLTHPAGVSTPFVVYRDFFSGRVQRERDAEGRLRATFVVSAAPAAGDVRQSPLDFSQADSKIGLHVLDFAFPQGDLLRQLGARVSALP